ncbi:MAG: septum site-determining protein MinC [Thermaerobacter sp.]|nr:septum site-determining protein MinC [Thermaerobacter sp.]
MEIKGDRRGLRIIARGAKSEEALLVDLRRTLAERAEFLGQSGLLVEIDGIPLSAALFQNIAEVFAGFPALTLRGIEQTDKANTLLALEPRQTPPEAPQIIRHTIRSGQRVTHNGDVIIIGDVNPGATVVAGGDVMVFGWLRGLVLAGQPDDITRAIYALRFQPTQIRVGSIMALGDESRDDAPEYARVENGSLVVDSWEDIRLPEAVTHEPRGWRERFAHLSNLS